MDSYVYLWLTTLVAFASSQTSEPVVFSAGLDKDVNVNAGDTVVYNVIYSNVGNSYNPNTGIFVCKKPGLYRFEVNLLTGDKKGSWLTIRHNDKDTVTAHGTGSVSNVVHNPTGGNSIILELAIGDTVSVVERDTTSMLHGGPGWVYNTFSGILLAERHQAFTTNFQTTGNRCQ
jgi:hypothetical protein